MAPFIKRCARLLVLVTATVRCGDGNTGPDYFDPLQVDRVTFASGGSHACGLDSRGAAWCWGSNWRGQLGNGSSEDSSRPVRVIGSHVFVSLTVSSWTTCAIDSSGIGWCWGDNQYGQLGAGWYDIGAFASEPQRVQASHSWVSISAGALQSCGLAADGTAFCWGSNAWGAVGTGNAQETHDEPTRVAGRLQFRNIDAGVYSVCGVTRAGKAFCWGRGEHGILGNGSESDRSTPTAVNSAVEWVNVSTGGVACGAATSGQLYCWGVLSYAPEGKGSRVEHMALVPEPMETAALVSEMDGMCMNMRQERASCLGSLWNGSIAEIRAQPVPGDIEFLRVAGSASHACGLSTDIRLYCWGENSVGQVGDGTTTNRLEPTLVLGSVDWVHAAPNQAASTLRSYVAVSTKQ